MSRFQGSLQMVYRTLTLRTCQPWGWVPRCTDVGVAIMVQTFCRYCSVGGTAGETSCLGTGVAWGIRHLLLALSSVSQNIVSSAPGVEATSSFGWREEERARR